MRYSTYTIDEITSDLYKKISQQLLNLAEDEEIKRKMKRHII